ncbi:MAG: thiamine diphosphokinase [Ruminococcus sp.]|jgi:thiamine pyrophosphokinase|nr:thiamine diphosphokinase [Ruminococcus sp.]
MAAVTIFAAGCYYDYKKIVLGELVIAADGGYTYCRDKKISPDVIIGDFDSLSDIPSGIKIVKLPVVKDITDTAAAVEYAGGFDEIHIYGGTGGRIDHTLANIAVISELSKKGKKAFLYDNGRIITAVTDGQVSFSPPETMPSYISVFSFSDISEGINLTGLKYPLKDAVLKSGVPLGVSNEFTKEIATVSVKHGTIIIVYDENAEIIAT